MYCTEISSLDNILNLTKIKAKAMIISGKKVEIEVSEYKPKRSNAQNSYYWIFNNEVAKFLNDSGLSYGEHNIPYDKDIIHKINKVIFSRDTTTKMSIGEFCEYMTKIIIWWTEKTNGMFSMPELPDEFLRKKGYEI